jgi:hypothetical protein
MSDELATEVIRLRHRLRAMAAVPGFDARSEAAQTLERFRALSESLGQDDLLFELARWRVQFEQLGV